MRYQEYLDSPLFWLRRVYLGTRKVLDQEFSQHQLSGAQFEVLRQLWQRDGLSQRDLEERLSVRSATLTRVLARLCAKGLVERRRNPEDGRIKEVFLTPQGQSLKESLERMMACTQARLLSGFTEAEIALAKEWLQRMACNMEQGGKTAVSKPPLRRERD